ncbi:MAG: DUF3159 domain-containing protein [Pseudolysinimonas sp.]
MSQALRRSGLGRVAPDQAPSAATLLTAMGGARGIVESILPLIVFLVTFTIARNTVAEKDVVLVSVTAPVVISVIFIVTRLVRREAVTPAIAGALGVVISAVFAAVTGKAENNFVPGFFINSGILVVMLVTIAVRRPLLGLLASLLLSDPDWRQDRAQLRVAYIATWFWVGLAVIRLGVELPLFVTHQITALGTARLITGVPLYAAILWLTWLVMRTAWTAPERVDDTTDGASEN